MISVAKKDIKKTSFVVCQEEVHWKGMQGDTAYKNKNARYDSNMLPYAGIIRVR